ncbi:hypothetical protein [Flavobacterium frigoris]|uniref:O-Antigen ligase n=1 Tax=Flavobacterium frigoris (strain PS1) TaxID=1086011 RepID=H7FMM6_FLAFP|nr:hypothetical protein [Flavobacterium frigoris]EIA10238.1 hypothetical protein HJ01_00333 [Flavobacterium frigoris PS1]
MQNLYLMKAERKTVQIILFLIGLSLVTSYFDFLIPGLRYIQYAVTPILGIYVLYFGLKKGKSLSVLRWFFIIFIIFFLRGLLLGNYGKYILGDILSWSFVFMVVFFNSDAAFYSFKSKIPEFMAKLLIVFIPFTLFVFFKYANISADITRSLIADNGVNEKAMFYPLLFAPLLLPFIFDFKLHVRIAVIVGNLMLVFFGIVTATRGMFMIPIVAFLLVFLLQKKMSFKIVIILILVIVTFLNIGSFSDNEVLKEKSDYLYSRFNEDKDVSGGRNSEIFDLFDEYTFTEFLIGRGAGGTHTFGFWKDVDTPLNLGANVAHYGVTHLLLKGGFVLLISFYSLALWAILNLYKKGDRKYMIVIILYLIMEISHNQFNNLAFLILFWVSISFSLKLTNKRKLINSSTI